jgi:hypothetical protein
MTRAYPNIADGEWLEPARKGFRLACCDCGLVHAVDFRLVPRGGGKAIQMRFRRDRRATGQRRRQFKPIHQRE